MTALDAERLAQGTKKMFFLLYVFCLKKKDYEG